MESNIEYWEPESLLAKLVVGAKVRARFSSECQLPVHTDSPAYSAGIEQGHEAEFAANGKTGIITDTSYPTYKQYGHRFRVRLDQKYPWNGRMWSHITVAAIELEPI